MIKNHVVSLEIAKQLKNAGWKKETRFYWADCSTDRRWEKDNLESLKSFMIIDDNTAISRKCNGDNFIYFAPLATELLEELPDAIHDDKEPPIYGYLWIHRVWNGTAWRIEYRYPTNNWYVNLPCLEYPINKSLPDALGMMYLNLTQNNLLVKE